MRTVKQKNVGPNPAQASILADVVKNDLWFEIPLCFE